MRISFCGTPIGQRINVIKFSDDGAAVVDVTEMTLPMQSGHLPSVVLGPDSSLLAAFDGATIQKLTPDN